MTALSASEAPPLRRQPEFLKLWAGQTISVFGDAITLLGLPLVAVLTLDASAAQMGLLTAAGLAPHLLLSLFAGVWIDRRARRRRLLVAADLGRAALLAWIPVAAVLDVLTLEQLFVVSFLVGALTVVFDVAWSSLFVLVVPTRDVVEANSKLSISRSASWMGGPPLAGALVELLTAPLAVAADAVSFLVSAAFVGRLRVEERPLDPDGNGVRARLAAGFGFLFGQPILRAGLACTATVNFFNFAFHAIFVLFATEELGVSPGLLGAVLGAGAVGSALGAVVAPALQRRIGIGPSYMLGAVLFPLPLVLVPLADGPLWLVAGLLFASEFLAGVGVMVFDVAGNSLNLVLTPQRLRARTVGTHRTINYGVRPLGALLGGLLGAAIGLRPTLWIATVGAAVSVVWLLFSPVPRLRELPEQAT
ncbi:MAG: MFS transporter [Actinomycetota bacterium]|nr:MFS transporter [Actinomycetota bacterium]